MERVNARLKIFWGMDDGNVKGPARFHAHVEAVMIVHLALAGRRAESWWKLNCSHSTRLYP